MASTTISLSFSKFNSTSDPGEIEFFLEVLCYTCLWLSEILPVVSLTNVIFVNMDMELIWENNCIFWLEWSMWIRVGLTFPLSWVKRMFWHFDFQFLKFQSAYANMFMPELGEKYIYPLIRDKPILFLHYTVIAFMMPSKSDNILRSFRNAIKRKYQTNKFKFNFFKGKIEEFLDTVVCKDKKNNLQTTLFKKPTGDRDYCRPKSLHPHSF